ncbi:MULTISPECIES: hypothetical protein [unclassified Roseitalea]|uniref:hypothetical protein n=1 Tax=unclassified Roseitalea TaxID=2639107 RepID=UPI00273F27BC|nr:MULTISPECIES: hypothetical protein [unclassified Roseitalea]
MRKTVNRALFALAALFTTTMGAATEPVSVNSPAGQGFAVTHNTICYVILPEHVHLGTTELSLSAGSPPVRGAGRVFQSFLPSMDLSVAVVTGGLTERCRTRFEDLPRDIVDLISLGGETSFVTVSGAGQIERVQGHIDLITYEMMEIEIADEGDRLFGGRSGGIVTAGGEPVGMIIEAITDRRARALRMDAIVARLDRLLANRGEAPPAPADRTEADTTIGLFGKAGDIAACSAGPVRPEASCWAMRDGAHPLLVAPDDLPLQIELRLEGGTQSIRRVEMRAVRAPGSTVPRSVIVERRAGSPDRPSWLSFGRADMTPFGELTLAHGAGLRTGALRITIVDSWQAGKAVRLDSIAVR